MGYVLYHGAPRLAWRTDGGGSNGGKPLATAVRGDRELRGAITSKTSGVYCGFVDPAMSDNDAKADVTIAPPYVRPPWSMGPRC